MARLPAASSIVITPIEKEKEEPVVPREEPVGNPQLGPDPAVHPAGRTDTSGGNNNSGGGVTLKPSGYSVSGYSVAPYDPATNKAYQDAMAKLNQAYANNPTYTPSYDDEIQRLYNEIVNRGKFNYDLLSDPLYQQYREQYVNQGNMAMMDTMGQAAALTGGYGSSYSQAVGQQQYNNYLNQLNQMVPEFYDRAFNHWQAQGQDLYNQYGLVSDMRDTEYGRYRDEVSDYWNQVNYLAGRADTYYNQGADNYWNTQSMNQTNYWNEQNMAFDNYWNQLNYELDAYNATKTNSGSGSGTGEETYLKGTDYTSWKNGLKNINVNVQGNQNASTSATNAARARYILQGVAEGKIDEATAAALQYEYGISDEEMESNAKYLYG